MLRTFCQAGVAIDPSKGSFNYPAAGRQFKADRVSSALDDLNGPVAEFGERGLQVGAVVAAVGKPVARCARSRRARCATRSRAVGLKSQRLVIPGTSDWPVKW